MNKNLKPVTPHCNGNEINPQSNFSILAEQLEDIKYRQSMIELINKAEKEANAIPRQDYDTTFIYELIDKVRMDND